MSAAIVRSVTRRADCSTKITHKPRKQKKWTTYITMYKTPKNHSSAFQIKVSNWVKQSSVHVFVCYAKRNLKLFYPQLKYSKRSWAMPSWKLKKNKPKMLTSPQSGEWGDKTGRDKTHQKENQQNTKLSHPTQLSSHYKCSHPTPWLQPHQKGWA